MQTKERAELTAEIQSVRDRWQETHGGDSCAIHALDALGYMAGTIFAQAPDQECKAYGRQQFMIAIDEGLSQMKLVPASELN